jgi:serine/threonine protein kinase/tetratricopeptide (TPR) repeat protein
VAADEAGARRDPAPTEVPSLAEPPPQQNLTRSGSDEGGGHRPGQGTLPAAGDLVGGEDGRRFVIEREIGSGSMGVVYLARDRLLDRTCALKFLRPRDHLPPDEQVALLLREARATARLDHENIVRIFDVGLWQGTLYLVMEHLEGKSLRDFVAARPLRLLQAVQIAAQIANGLEQAHAAGVVHRDLKPGNVFILRDGRVKILDFGLALPAPSDGGPRFASAGTPGYMAPEQWRGDEQDHRTDLWSAGVILYELITGELPYDGRSREEVRAAALGEAPLVSARDRLPELPAAVEEVLERALRRHPSARFGSARELRDDLLAVAAELVRTGPSRPMATERRPLTLISCRLEGLSGDDDADELLEQLHRRCGEAVAINGGHVVTFVGSQMLACFGYPTVRELDAHSAVRAALALVRAASNVAGVSLSIGVHTGVVLLHASGGASSDAPALQGDALARVAALAQGAAAGNVLISAETARLVRGSFLLEPVGDGFRALGERRSSSRFAPLTTFGLVPMVGRQAELGRLTAAWERARDGRGGLVLVVGEAGVGKSRLVRCLRDQVGNASLRLDCHAWPHARDSALHPVIDLFLRAARIEREGSPSRRRERLERLAAQLGLDQPESVSLLASLLSIPVDQAPALPSRRQRDRTFAVVAAALQQLAAHRPVLITVEDLHWLDHSSRELIGALLPQLARSRVLLVATARPEFEAPWSGFETVSLDALPPELTAELVRAAGAGRLPDALVTELVERSEGVPLFAEELTRTALAPHPAAQDAIRRHTSLPATLQALLADRLDQAGGVAKDVAQLAAVLGRSFSLPLLLSLAGGTEDELAPALADLVSAGVLTPEDHRNRLGFRHVLIQQAAYQLLAPARRRQLHERVAVTLRERFPETAEAEPELLAHHEREARAYGRAVASWMRAGQIAVSRSAYQEAVGHFTNALDAFGRDETHRDRAQQAQGELPIRLSLGNALVAARGYGVEEVQSTFARALVLCRDLGDTPLLPNALRGLWQYYFGRAEFTISIELFEQLLALGAARNDVGLTLLGHRLGGFTRFALGQLEGAAGHLDAVMALYDPEKVRALGPLHALDCLVTTWMYRAWHHCLAGRLDEGARCQVLALERAAAVGDHQTSALALSYASTVRQFRREPAEARRLAESAAALSFEYGLPLWIAWAENVRGWALVQQGQSEGLAVLHRSIERWTATGSRVGQSYFHMSLADAHLALGSAREGLTAVETGLDWAARLGEGFYVAELERLGGELSAAAGAAPGEVRRRLDASLAAARMTGAHGCELRAALATARLLDDRGPLREVWPRIDHTGESPDLVEARRYGVVESTLK